MIKIGCYIPVIMYSTIHMNMPLLTLLTLVSSKSSEVKWIYFNLGKPVPRPFLFSKKIIKNLLNVDYINTLKINVQNMFKLLVFSTTRMRGDLNS